MTATFIQSTVGSGDSYGLSVAAGAITTTSGNALLVTVTCDTTFGNIGTVDDNKTNTFTPIGSQFVDTNGNAIQHFYCLNINGGSSHTVTAHYTIGNVLWRRIIVHEVSGIATSGAFDKDSGGRTQTASDLSDNAVTPTTDGQYIFAAVLNGDAAATDTFSAAGSFVEPTNSTASPAYEEVMSEYYVQTTAAQIQAQFTRSNSGFCTMRTSTYKAASADGSGVGAASGTGAAPAIGSSLAASIGSAAGTSTAPGIGSSVAASVGAAAGVGAATAISGATGLASGVGAASGIGSSLAASVGSAAGVGGAAAVSGAIAFSEGIGTASGISTSLAASDGAAVGDGAATAISGAVGLAVGIGTAPGIGSSLVAAIGSAAGVGDATAAPGALCLASGVGAASGVGTSLAASDGAAVGDGVATAISGAIGLASGTGTAPGIGSSLVVAIASAAGVGDAAAVSGAIAFSEGVGTASGIGASLAEAVGSASGIGSADAVPLEGAFGSASGVGDVLGVGAALADSEGYAPGIGATLAIATGGVVEVPVEVQSCADCVYFVEGDPPQDELHVQLGHCHRYAPILITDYPDTFPEVRADWWCREFTTELLEGQCINCIAWSPIDNPAWLDLSSDPLLGECRRKAPRSGYVGKGSQTIWPIVAREDGCGEFQDKNVLPPDYSVTTYVDRVTSLANSFDMMIRGQDMLPFALVSVEVQALARNIGDGSVLSDLVFCTFTRGDAASLPSRPQVPVHHTNGDFTLTTIDLRADAYGWGVWVPTVAADVLWYVQTTVFQNIPAS